MLIAESWVKNHQLWERIRQSRVLPFAGHRMAIALALAGIYALIAAIIEKDSAFKPRIVRILTYYYSAQLSLPMRGQEE
jgi:hypothetical protein